MRVAELIGLLEKLSPNDAIYLTIPGTNILHSIDDVVTNSQPPHVPYIESHAVPDFEGVCGIAGACFSEHKDRLSEREKDLLVTIADEPHYKEMRNL